MLRSIEENTSEYFTSSELCKDLSLVGRFDKYYQITQSIVTLS